MKKSTIILAAFSLLSLGACNNTGDNAAVNKYSTEEPPAAGTLILNAGDDMKYDKSQLHVKTGETVTLILHHTGKADKAAMGHNVVILNSGVDMNAFASQALSARDNDYIPNDPKDILAHTGLIGGGESDTISFTAPAAGTYDYLCSFPGHAPSMNGKLIVE